MNKINRYLRQLHVVWFILLFTLLRIVFSIILPELEPLGIPNYHFYPTPDEWDLGLVDMIVMVVIFAPFFETLLFQILPYLLLSKIRYLREKPVWIILIAALLFTAIHNYSIHYMIYAFIGGVMYMYAYIIRLPKNSSVDKNSYLTVVVIHALVNLFATLGNHFFPELA